MRSVLQQFAVIVSFLFVLPGSMPSQKAVPVRIQFKQGSMSSTVQGSVRGRQQMEYVLRMAKSRKLTLRLSSPAPATLMLKVRDPHGKEIQLQSSGERQWVVAAAESGDFDIWVVRVNDKPGVSTYKLTVDVR